MMTLDEAIVHAKETAKKLRAMTSVTNGKPYEECLECAAEHEQLAEWLTELQERREADRWIPVSERMPEGKINPNTNDLEEVLCSTIWGDVRPYKYGKPIGHDKAHFWLGGGIMDEYVIAWQYKPEPYKKGGAE